MSECDEDRPDGVTVVMMALGTVIFLVTMLLVAVLFIVGVLKWAL